MPEKQRREISRRVTERKVLGSANPVAKWGRESKSTCMDSIGGFFVGLLLFFVTFAIPYSAAKTEKDSTEYKKLPQVSAAEAATLNGKALVEGTLTAGSTIKAPTSEVTQPILGYRYILERYEPHQETHTETKTEIENGQEVEYTEEVTEEVWDWETLQTESDWAVIKLNTITIDPEQCDIRALPWVNVYQDSFTDPETGYDMRASSDVIYAGTKVLLAAEFANGQVVANPDFYRISIGTREELVAQANSEEESGRWVKIILSVILWTISFNLMIGPAMILINIIPIKVLSGAIRGVITFFSLIAACATTFVTYVFIRYWWVIVALLVLLAVYVVVNATRRRTTEPDLEAAMIEPEPTTEDKP